MPKGLSSGKHILVVDDEPLVRQSLGELLTLSGYTVSTASSGKDAIDFLKVSTVNVIISDIKMPELDGMELLKLVKTKYPKTAVILMTGYGSIENAIDAIKQGAYDYITKPIVDNEILIVVERFINQERLKEENASLKEQLCLSQRESFQEIIGKDKKMQNIYTLVEAIACTRATVLIHGESGTGKRLIAHAIHNCNEQEKGKPFIEVSCGALTETLLESELFGHVKGAFTGAIKDKAGRFELANGGTILLDEIDAFSPALQVKLLRVLQEGEFERVGDTKTVKVDVRIIAATNQNLDNLIAEGKFRQDLYYRLNIICIEVPPLRERKSDIPLLVGNFIKKHTEHINKRVVEISSETLEVLMNYSWPGNVRELENVIERATILSKGPKIILEDLPESLNKQENNRSAINELDNLKLKEALKSPEKDLILKALYSTGWNRNETAKALGINRTTLYKKMQEFGLLKNNKTNAEKD